MSLALHLAGDAQVELRRIDTWLQEEVLDELERFANDPTLIPPPIPGWGSVHAFARVSGGILHVVTLTVAHNPQTQTLTVLGVQVQSSS